MLLPEFQAELALKRQKEDLYGGYKDFTSDQVSGLIDREADETGLPEFAA